MIALCLLQVGVAIGFLIPPEIVKNDINLDVVASQISYMFYGGAAVTTCLFIAVCICKYTCADHRGGVADNTLEIFTL